MYDLDIALMALSQPSGYASIKFLRLFNYFSAIGLNCKVSTHPSELSSARPFRRRHAIILDGTDNSEHDVYALASDLGTQPLAFVILLVGNSQYPLATYDPRQGVDLCLPIQTSQEHLAEKIITALHDKDPHPNAQQSKNFDTQGDALTPLSAPHPHAHLDILHNGVATLEDSSLNANFHQHGVWFLKDRGWKLIAPTGQAVALTSVERNLMRRFFKSPTKAVLPHDFDGRHSSSNQPHLESLTVAINGLRQKFRAAGLSLPIHSCRGEGYMFTGPRNTSQQTLDQRH